MQEQESRAERWASTETNNAGLMPRSSRRMIGVTSTATVTHPLKRRRSNGPIGGGFAGHGGRLPPAAPAALRKLSQPEV